MNGFVGDIEKLTKENDNFRKVIFTGEHSQLVLMSLKPGEDIGKEVHQHVDQFFRVDSGEGEVFIDGETTQIADGFAVVVPAGSEHNVTNTGQTDLKLYTVYSPPNHPAGTLHATRKEAIAAEVEEHHK